MPDNISDDRLAVKVVAIAFFRSTDQKYFICRRGPAESGAGAWEFPGGKIDIDETEKEALVREIQEELSVQIQAKELIYISAHDHQYENKKIHITLYKYNVENLNYTLVDHDQAVWVSLSEIGNYQLSQADVPFLQKLI
jgi:8-oxo-dGTP diphosphatase